MLSEQHRDLVKATVPLLEAGGEALTRHFYGIMLDEYPQVRPLFNQAHQASGAQPRALANGILQYARHIDHLDALGPLVGQVVQKHVSLQVLPEQYPIVGAACCGRFARCWARRWRPMRSSTPGRRPISSSRTC